jgi:hypothetical protein
MHLNNKKSFNRLANLNKELIFSIWVNIPGMKGQKQR